MDQKTEQEIEERQKTLALMLEHEKLDKVLANEFANAPIEEMGEWLNEIDRILDKL